MSTTKKIVALSRRGFSLIEIMVVIAIIAVIAGLGTVYVMGQLQAGKISTARTQAMEIAKALDLYKLQTGSYPTTSEGLDVLANPSRGQPIMEKVPKDPWGKEYNYAIPGTRNPKGFDVWSYGPDGTENEEDAIGNWEED